MPWTREEKLRICNQEIKYRKRENGNHQHRQSRIEKDGWKTKMELIARKRNWKTVAFFSRMWLRDSEFSWWCSYITLTRSAALCQHNVVRWCEIIDPGSTSCSGHNCSDSPLHLQKGVSVFFFSLKVINSEPTTPRASITCTHTIFFFYYLCQRTKCQIKYFSWPQVKKGVSWVNMWLNSQFNLASAIFLCLDE